MSTTINGISAYAVRTRGAAQYFIRVAVVNAADVADFDAAETAGASANGLQTVDFDGSVVGGNATGLANDATTYTATIVIDGTSYPISVVGSAAQTFTTLVTEINADLPGTECAISGGNLVVTSTTTGLSSYVSITDVDLFSSCTGFAGVLTAIDGGLEGQLRGVTLPNGANAWNAYKSAVEVYDTSANATIVASKYAVSDLNVTYSDTEVEAEFGLVKAKLDALQEIVESKVLNK